MTTFFDTRNIRAGDAWWKRIQDEIERSSMMLAFVTPAYLASDVCRKEFSMFRKAGGPRLVVPLAFVDPARTQAIYHDDQMWREILQIQYLDISMLWAEDPGSGIWNVWVDEVARSLESPNGSAPADADPISAANGTNGGAGPVSAINGFAPLDDDLATATVHMNGDGGDPGPPHQRPDSEQPGEHDRSLLRELFPKLTNVSRNHLDEQRVRDLHDVAIKVDSLRSKVENEVAPGIRRVTSFASKASTARRHSGDIDTLAASLCNLAESLERSYKALNDEAVLLLRRAAAGESTPDEGELQIVVQTLASAGYRIGPSAHQRQVLMGEDVRTFSPVLEATLTRVQYALDLLDKVQDVSAGWMAPQPA